MELWLQVYSSESEQKYHQVQSYSWMRGFALLFWLRIRRHIQIQKNIQRAISNKRRQFYGHYLSHHLEFFSPTLTKNELNWFEISVFSSIFWPFIVKNAGFFLSLYLFRISLIVDQVCLIFDLFLISIVLYFRLSNNLFEKIEIYEPQVGGRDGLVSDGIKPGYLKQHRLIHSEVQCLSPDLFKKFWWTFLWYH